MSVVRSYGNNARSKLEFRWIGIIHKPDQMVSGAPEGRICGLKTQARQAGNHQDCPASNDGSEPSLYIKTSKPDLIATLQPAKTLFSDHPHCKRSTAGLRTPVQTVLRAANLCENARRAQC